MVQRRKGLRLHHRGRLRGRHLCALVGDPGRRLPGPRRGPAGGSSKSARAKRARRPKASGPPSEARCPSCRPPRPWPFPWLPYSAPQHLLRDGRKRPGGTVEASGDGVLRVGLILDNTGDNASSMRPSSPPPSLPSRTSTPQGATRAGPSNCCPHTRRRKPPGRRMPCWPPRRTWSSDPPTPATRRPPSTFCRAHGRH